MSFSLIDIWIRCGSLWSPGVLTVLVTEVLESAPNNVVEPRTLLVFQTHGPAGVEYLVGLAVLGLAPAYCMAQARMGLREFRDWLKARRRKARIALANTLVIAVTVTTQCIVVVRWQPTARIGAWFHLGSK